MTAYRPSPRPTFDGAALIPYAGVTRHIWGDPEAGEVADWIYASTERVHALVARRARLTRDDDELVEVTPVSIRLRKKLLTENERKRESRKTAEG